MTLMLAAGLSNAAVPAASSSDPKYRITDIGTLGGSWSLGYGLNKSGQVTGTSAIAGDSANHAFLWRNDGTPMVDIGALGVAGGWGTGDFVNSSGQVAGDVQTVDAARNEYGLLWRNDGSPAVNFGVGTNVSGINDRGQVSVNYSDSAAYVWLNDGRPPQNIGTLGGIHSYSDGINASGQVTGAADVPYNGNFDHHAFLWTNFGTPMADLGTLGGNLSEGNFINSSGMVAGRSGVKPYGIAYHAFLWRNNGKPMVNLGTLGGLDSWPTAMNDSGQVVGVSFVSHKDSSTEHAFLWRNDGSRIVNLGTLGGKSSIATGINSSGWVVGNAAAATEGHAFLWKDDGRGMRDLNALIDPTDPLKPYVILSSADAINDSGDIMASGYDIRGPGASSGAYFLRGSSLALSPRTLAFGNQATGTASASKSVTVQNNTYSAVPITSIALAGAQANQFTSSSNCGSSVASKGSCTIKVTFKPTSAGAKSATLSVNGGGGGLRVVNLEGTGV